MSAIMLGIYVLVGVITGLLGGLLGIGGGMIVVPALMMCFEYQGVHPDSIMHLAIGTSMASIVFTALSSSRAHHRRQAVLWNVVRYVAPGLLLGTFVGTWFASLVPGAALRVFFVVFLAFVIWQILSDHKPKPSRQLPSKYWLSAMGTGIGLISSWVGIGGGSMSVPLLTWHNVPVKAAIGTSAALGLPIAVAGTAGYIVNGWYAAHRPEGSLGFVYVPALLAIAIPSVLLAPLGASWSHRLPGKLLHKIFAGFLIVVALRILADVVW